MFKKVIVAISILLLFGAVGCSTNDNEKETGIKGTITKVITNDSGKITGISVEEKEDQSSTYGKASVFIEDKTKIYKGNSNKLQDISILKEGIRIQVTIEGGVRESYPVQVDAKIIRVLEE